MRNESRLKKQVKSGTIIKALEGMPYFDSATAKNLIENDSYLKIILSRYAKSKKIIRLKKGLYTSKHFVDTIEKKGLYSLYIEFISHILYRPSYLSGEYVLQKYNILSEAVFSMTNTTAHKTARFINSFGVFRYHSIREDLFIGYTIHTKDDFTIFEATKAKALFDYLYFRKNNLVNESAIFALRLNMDTFTKKDVKEFKKYVIIENSKRLKNVYTILF